jgi:hypothetical protein
MPYKLAAQQKHKSRNAQEMKTAAKTEFTTDHHIISTWTTIPSSGKHSRLSSPQFFSPKAHIFQNCSLGLAL